MCFVELIMVLGMKEIEEFVIWGSREPWDLMLIVVLGLR